MSDPKWKTESYRLLNMGPEERRKSGMYDNKTVVTVDMVDPWPNYCARNKNLENDRKYTLDDLTEFKKVKLNSEQNKLLSHKVSIFKGDITQLEVCANLITS